MAIALSVLPVILFLLFLFLIDSFKLVYKKIIAFSLIWGGVSALLVFITGVDSQYLSPLIEEALKAFFILVLIYKNRVGFMIDAAIYGFAAGAGFSLVENMFYLSVLNDATLPIWIIRGFGTALMHGGCTALLAMLVMDGKSRGNHLIINLIVGYFVAYTIHLAFNLFYINPLIQTIGVIIILPPVFILIFQYNEKQLNNWLEIEFNSEVELLNMIKKGKILSTRSGEYLESLKSRFSAETILDMYCYISLYLELSIKAKRNLMLRESDIPIIREDGLDEMLSELKSLRHRIGKVGQLTLAPLIRMNYRNLWKLTLLE
jgi:protease PrsW